jgi:hypothetical protein
VTITFDDPTLVGCTTFGLDTKDGGIVNLGCDVSESPGYGQWERIGHRKFAVTFVGANFGAAGTGFNSTYKVRSTIHLSHDGQTSSGPFVVEIFALDGTPLLSATGTVHGKRVGIEPLQRRSATRAPQASRSLWSTPPNHQERARPC